MGLIRLMKRVVGGGYGAVQPGDQIACDVTLTTIKPTGASASSALADLLGRLDSYRYVKAMNFNATTSAAGGFGALVAFVTVTNSDGGSNAVQCLFAVFTVIGTGTTAGNGFETQLLS